MLTDAFYMLIHTACAKLHVNWTQKRTVVAQYLCKIDANWRNYMRMRIVVAQKLLVNRMQSLCAFY